MAGLLNPETEEDRIAQQRALVSYADDLSRQQARQEFMSALGNTWPAQMAKSAYQAVRAPGDVAKGRLDPRSNEAIKRAADLAGMMVTGGMPLAQRGALGTGGGRMVQPDGIRAYHGSPHDFDKFSLDKIGTGEGAQAFGHGLYFAEKEGVARSYKAAGQPSYLGADRIQAARDLLAESGGDQRAAMALANQRMVGAQSYGDSKLWQDVVNNFDDLAGKTPGKMYEVNIKADPDAFLDWDKPLAQQKSQLSDGINSVVRLTQQEKENLPTRSILEMLGSPQEATARLRDAGIPGIKYLDQGSRGAGQGSRNYVVFDDKLIDILRKYGLVGMLGGGAVAAGVNAPMPSKREDIERGLL